MLAAKLYLWSHIALLGGAAASATLRILRRDPLVLFGNDLMYLLLAFMLIGGGLVLGAG